MIAEKTQETIQHLLSNSLAKVMQTMAGVECLLTGVEEQRGRHTFAPSLSEANDSLVAASVGFAGKLNGIIYLFLQSDHATHLATAITGLEDDELDSETVHDVCGEMTNMLAGTFKNHLADQGLTSMLSIPTVMTGNKLTISVGENARQHRFHFTEGDRRLCVDLILAEN